MNEQYALYLKMLSDICHERKVCHWKQHYEKLLEYGWIKRKLSAGNDVELFERQDASWFVLTAKGHHVLSPRDCRISRQNAPNFDFSGQKGLHVCWGMHKRVTPLHEDIPRLRYLYRYSVDSETIVALGKYLVEAVGYMGQSPWDVGREARA